MFIASYHERSSDRILVWERSPSGNRILKTYDAPYFFYVPDKDGEFTTITEVKCKKVEFSSKNEFEQACYSYPKRFESDLSPLEKIMTEKYSGTSAPKLVIGFTDIEVDYDEKIGFSSPSNPYAPINAITLYRTDLNSYFTLAVPPPGWNETLPDEMNSDNYFICSSERELLEQFLDLCDDVDVVSGWNSEFFDLPYIGKRIELLFGPHALRRLAFDRGPMPRWTEHERFKGSDQKELVLELNSRVHLDYMRLFKKFTLGGRPSYSLANIANDELDIPKLDYEGTLYSLYRNDFKHFLLYNRRDVEIIVKLDQKFNYVQLANTMVHEATVNFSSIFGSVQLIDTAIINYAHNIMGKRVLDKQHREGNKVEGGLVLTPTPGLHKWIGSCDINSLYPSTYRSLNLSPEKIVGQLVECERGWRAVFDLRLDPENEALQNRELNLVLEGMDEDEPIQISAKDLLEMLIEKKFAISAYGTILDQSQGEGLLPAVFSYWFKGRKELQAVKKKHAKAAEAILISGIKVPAGLLLK